MLLFNVPDFKSFIWMFPFQNISCYCLTNTLLRSIFIANISKHLMLLFNTAGELEAVSDAIFQNISCYCLTQIHIIRNILLSVFQNISCYCLTTKPLQSAVPRCGFQNISCYCLTPVFPFLFNFLSDFKTSHVIV